MGSATGRRVVVLGLGNTLRRDDGVGPRVVAALAERVRTGGNQVRGVELLEGGLSPFDALCGRGGGKLLVIDAARGGGAPGTVYRAGRDGIEPSGEVISSHGLGLAEALAQLELSGDRWDEVVLLGVEPADTGWGEDLSPQVERVLAEVVNMAERELALQGRHQT